VKMSGHVIYLQPAPSAGLQESFFWFTSDLVTNGGKPFQASSHSSLFCCSSAVLWLAEIGRTNLWGWFIADVSWIEM
jgi:hypothetical protein